MKVLRDCLAPDGCLYLGVNGAAHHATSVQSWLQAFGVTVTELEDEPRVRQLLRLWKTVAGEGAPDLDELPSSYLASDVCGPWFNNWSLERWAAAGRNAGLAVVAAMAVPRQMRRLLNGDCWQELYRSSREDLAVRLDHASAGSFHQLLLRQRPRNPDRVWTASVTARPQVRWTGLYSMKLRPGAPGRRSAILTAPAFNLRLEWPLTSVPAEFFRSLATAPRRGELLPARIWQTASGRKLLWAWEAFGVVQVQRQIT